MSTAAMQEGVAMLKLFQELEEMESSNKKKREDYFELQYKKKFLEDRKVELKRELYSLQMKKETIQAKMAKDEYERPKNLRKAPTQPKAPFNQMDIHRKFVKGIIKCLCNDVEMLLKCSHGNDARALDTRDTYRVYGLLLSACNMKERDSNNKEIIAKSFEQLIQPVQNEPKVKKYVEQAVGLTYNMLTLLPPLIVTIDLPKMMELLHDTNRITWDETKASSKELIYYRPILVYGNNLSHVAVKGLVGNNKEITESTNDQVAGMADSATKMCSPMPNHPLPSHPHSVDRNDDPSHMPAHMQPISRSCPICMTNHQQEIIANPDLLCLNHANHPSCPQWQGHWLCSHCRKSFQYTES